MTGKSPSVFIDNAHAVGHLATCICHASPSLLTLRRTMMMMMMFGRASCGPILGCWVQAFALLPDVSSPDLVPGPHALQLLPRLLCLRTTVLHIYLSFFFDPPPVLSLMASFIAESTDQLLPKLGPLRPLRMSHNTRRIPFVASSAPVPLGLPSAALIHAFSTAAATAAS